MNAGEQQYFDNALEWIRKRDCVADVSGWHCIERVSKRGTKSYLFEHSTGRRCKTKPELLLEVAGFCELRAQCKKDRENAAEILFFQDDTEAQELVCKSDSESEEDDGAREDETDSTFWQCVKCSKDDDEPALQCDECDKFWHMHCCYPALQEVPKGDWFCFECIARADVRAAEFEAELLRDREVQLYEEHSCILAIARKLFQDIYTQSSLMSGGHLIKDTHYDSTISVDPITDLCQKLEIPYHLIVPDVHMDPVKRVHAMSIFRKVLKLGLLHYKLHNMDAFTGVRSGEKVKNSELIRVTWTEFLKDCQRPSPYGHSLLQQLMELDENMKPWEEAEKMVMDRLEERKTGEVTSLDDLGMLLKDSEYDEVADEYEQQYPGMVAEDDAWHSAEKLGNKSHSLLEAALPDNEVSSFFTTKRLAECLSFAESVPVYVMQDVILAIEEASTADTLQRSQGCMHRLTETLSKKLGLDPDNLTRTVDLWYEGEQSLICYQDITHIAFPPTKRLRLA